MDIIDHLKHATIENERLMRISAKEFFQEVNMASLLPQNIGARVGQSVAERQYLASKAQQKDWIAYPIRVYQELIMRVLVFHFPRNSLEWFTVILSKLSSAEVQLAYLSHVPGIPGNIAQGIIAEDWVAAFASHFLLHTVALGDIWTFMAPAIKWTTPRLTFSAMRRCRTHPFPPPSRLIEFVHSRLKNRSRLVSKPPPKNDVSENYEWHSITFLPRQSKKWHILPTKDTLKKLNATPVKTIQNTKILLWKKAIDILKSPEWKPVYPPFSRGNRGFFILRKHLDLFAIIGDKRWGLDVWRLIEDFMADCSWFTREDEDGVQFDRSLSRRTFMTAAYDVLVSNYFFGVWLDSLGLIQKKTKEHLAGSHMECVWFVTVEEHADKGTLPVAIAWLKAPIFFILDRLADLFADIVGWKTPAPKTIGMGKRLKDDSSLLLDIGENPVEDESSDSVDNALSGIFTPGPSNPPSEERPTKIRRELPESDIERTQTTTLANRLPGPNTLPPRKNRLPSSSTLASKRNGLPAPSTLSSRKKSARNRKTNRQRRQQQRHAGHHSNHAGPSSNVPIPTFQPVFSPDSAAIDTSPKPSPFLSSTFSTSVSQDLSPGSPMVWVSSELQASFSFRSSLNSFESLSSMKSIRDALDEVHNDDQAAEPDAPDVSNN